MYKNLTLLGHANDLYTFSLSPLYHLKLLILHLFITSRYAQNSTLFLTPVFLCYSTCELPGKFLLAHISH